MPTGHLGVTEVPGMWPRPRVFAGVSVQKVELRCERDAAERALLPQHPCQVSGVLSQEGP